jgi:hypothetical protein
MTEEEMNDADMFELIEEYCDQKNIRRWEGDQGLDNLNTLLKTIGYKPEGFKYGSPVEKFLTDNPGAIEALIEFISDAGIDDWGDGLRAEIETDDEEDTEEKAIADNFNAALQFTKDMEEAGFEVREYKGRYFYNGPAVSCSNLQSVLSSTKVPCQWDQLGLGWIVYPK